MFFFESKKKWYEKIVIKLLRYQSTRTSRTISKLAGFVSTLQTINYVGFYIAVIQWGDGVQLQQKIILLKKSHSLVKPYNERTPDIIGTFFFVIADGSICHLFLRVVEVAILWIVNANWMQRGVHFICSQTLINASKLFTHYLWWYQRQDLESGSPIQLIS